MLRMLSFFSICNLDFTSRLQVYSMKEYTCILVFLILTCSVCFLGYLRFSIYYVCNIICFLHPYIKPQWG